MDKKNLFELSRTKFLLTVGMLRGKGEITKFEQDDLVNEYHTLHPDTDIVQSSVPPAIATPIPELKEAGTIKIIELKEPFWGAGTIYKWLVEFPDLVGFGVKATDLKENTELLIKVGPNSKYGEFSVNTEHARQIVKEYNSFKKVGTTVLAVIPRAICTTLTDVK